MTGTCPPGLPLAALMHVVGGAVHVHRLGGATCVHMQAGRGGYNVCVQMMGGASIMIYHTMWFQILKFLVNLAELCEAPSTQPCTL